MESTNTPYKSTKEFSYYLEEFRNDKYFLEFDEHLDYEDRKSHCIHAVFDFIDQDIINIKNCEFAKKTTTVIDSLESLKTLMNELIDYASKIIYSEAYLYEMVDQYMEMNGTCMIQNYNPYNTYNNSREPIFQKDKDLLLNQLIFDVLYEKYQDDIGEMTLDGYCQYMCENFTKILVPNYEEYLNVKENEYVTKEQAIKDFKLSLSEHVKNLSKTIDHSTKKHVESPINTIIPFYLGLNYKHINNKMLSRSKTNEEVRPKIFWDNLFYRSVSFPKTMDGRANNLILSKQSKGVYGKYKEHKFDSLIKDLKTYDEFVNLLLSEYDNIYEEKKAYFMKSMAYYHLESSHRMDYIYKTSILLESRPHPKIDKSFVFSLLYTPTVVYPIINNNKIDSIPLRKQYYPMIYHDDCYIKEYIYSPTLTLRTSYSLNKRIRAKVIELFKGYYKFESDNYSDIYEFLTNKYPILTYHDANKLWNFIDSFDNKTFDSVTIRKLLNLSPLDKIETSKIIKDLLNRTIEVNNSLFSTKIEKDSMIKKPK